MSVPTSNIMNTTNQCEWCADESDSDDDTVYFEKENATISNDIRGLNIHFPDNDEGVQILDLPASTNLTSGRQQPLVRVHLQNMDQAVGQAIFNAAFNNNKTKEDEPLPEAELDASDKLDDNNTTEYVSEENIRKTSNGESNGVIYFLDEDDDGLQVRELS